jgi:transposase InsO family protein
VKYACIAQHHGDQVPHAQRYPVRLMCRALAVSPSGFYAAQARAPSARAQADLRLRLAIRAAHAESHRRYGAPKIHAELRAQGLRCGHNRAARLMRLDGLRGTTPRRFRVTTQSRHPLPIATNQLDRQFSVAVQCERDWRRTSRISGRARDGSTSPWCSTWRRDASLAGVPMRASMTR